MAEPNPDSVATTLRVSDVMTPGPRTCGPDSSVIEAVMIFKDADCGVIPITTDGKPVGVLTDRDVALALPSHEADLASLPVREIMSTRIETIRDDCTLDQALATLGDEGVRRLLVVNDAHLLVGVLSWSDLVPHVSDEAMGRAVAEIAAHREAARA